MKQSFVVKLTLSVLLFVIFAVPHSVKANSNIDIEKIDEYVKEEFSKSNVPGLGISIVNNKEVMYMKNLGYGDVENKKVLTADTPMIIGSTSKSITALAIMQLVHQGKIDVNAPIKKYLPWFKLKDDMTSDEIKVINLLDHTSGLSRYSSIKYVSEDDLNDINSYIRELSKVSIKEEVGKKYQYSNENYQILGLLIESVSGMSYSDYLRKNIFSKLDMKNSFTSKTEAEKDNLACGYEYMFGLRVKRNLSYPSAYLPCGYVISSLEDMSKYMMMQINGGSFKNKEVINSEGLTAMHSPQVSVDDKSNNVFYGMGWVIDKTNGTNIIKHDGSIENYRSNLIIIPEKNLGIVVMCNANNVLMSSDFVSRVSDGITSIIYGKEPPKKAAAFPYSYAVIDLIVILSIVLSLMPLLYIKRISNTEKAREFTVRYYIEILLINFILPSTVCIYISNIIGTAWFFIFRYAPDIGCAMVLNFLILLITGVIEIRIIRRKRLDNKSLILR